MCAHSEGTKPRSQGGLTREGPPQLPASGPPQPTLAALPPFCPPGPAQTSPLSARQRGPLPAQAPAHCAAESRWLQPSVPTWVTPPDPQLLQAGPTPRHPYPGLRVRPGCPCSPTRSPSGHRELCCSGPCGTPPSGPILPRQPSSQSRLGLGSTRALRG